MMTNKSRNSGYIAIEGRSLLIVVALLLFLSIIFEATGFWILLFSLALAFGLYFFRNPEKIPHEDGDNLILSPIDGVISEIESKDGEIIVVFKNGILDSHLLRSPICGEVDECLVMHGTLLSNENPKASLLNETRVLKIERKGAQFVISAVAEHIGYGFSLYQKSGERVKMGQRIGFLPLGDVVLSLPQNCRLIVNVGERVSGGESIIGYINEA